MKAINFLFKLNNTLYTYLFHVPFLALWMYLMTHGIFTNWFVAGITYWALLAAYRSITSGPEEVKQIFKEDGMLAFLVGLNIAVLLGPISPLLSVMLYFVQKQQKQ